MAKRIVFLIASLSFLSISIIPMAVADSVDSPKPRRATPAEHIVSHPTDSHELKIDLRDNPSLAENNDSKKVTGWSEIWE